MRDAHDILSIYAADPYVITCTCGLDYTAPTLAGAVALHRQHQAARRAGAMEHTHIVLVIAKAGDHWECTCKLWRFDSPDVVDDDEYIAAVKEWTEHVEFEERYGSRHVLPGFSQVSPQEQKPR